ncbi:uncharacterized protein LOC135699060 [Ochlerotatus camptorhynchus]|uniref:uncharacterized protein LOC135699060 n=1 Tax=Ochlerotatus camptorhynchus TaxID=644619 RepID=UPI0031DED4E9
MEQLRNSLDGESYHQLVANKVTDRALLMFEDADLFFFLCHPRLKSKKTPEEKLRAVLLDDAKFRFVVYNELDQNKVPSEKHLREMCSILCRHQFEKSIYDNKGILVKHMIRTFPQLKSTRANENAPEESAFFWWHNGNSKGDHGGYIYHKVRNIIKGLPKEIKKYSRPDLINKQPHPPPPDGQFS